MTRPQPLRKIDGRTLDARRFKDLVASLTLPEVQLAQTKKLCASLALEAERLDCMQRNQESIDPDLLVRIANALNRSLERVNELTPKRNAYWESPADIAAREERVAWLDTLTREELTELRNEIAPVQEISTPGQGQVRADTAEWIAAKRVEIDEARARAPRTQRKPNASHQENKEEEEEGERGCAEFDAACLESLIEVLR